MTRHIIFLIRVRGYICYMFWIFCIFLYILYNPETRLEHFSNFCFARRVRYFTCKWNLFNSGSLGYHYLNNTKIKNSTAAAVEFWILLSTIIQLIAKFKIINSAAPAAEFWILNFDEYHYLNNSKNQNYKFGRAGGRILNF